VTSVDDVTTCTSAFVREEQSIDCTSDAGCTAYLGVDAVCVDAPCLPPSAQKVCMNKGCVDLTLPDVTVQSGRNAPALRQIDLRSLS
jgi:hypothetical protein